jgi:hypothetical protein
VTLYTLFTNGQLEVNLNNTIYHIRGGGLVVEMLLLLPRGVGFDPCWAILFFNVLPLILRVAAVWLCLGAAGRERQQPWHTWPEGTTTALSGRLGPWRSCCIAWEVAASRGHGAGGRLRPAGAPSTVATIGRWQNQVQNY